MSTAAPLSTAAQRAPAAAGVAPAVRCENCGAAVAQRYCGACGQRREPPVHSLWHFTQVATEDLTHADSRLWRTLAALLFKPGYLTAQFLAGRRASYLPPVRLYLVLSVLFFIWVSAAQTNLQVVQFDAKPAAGATRVSTPFSPALPGESAQQRSERLCHDAVYQGPWQQQLAPLVSRACRRVVEDSGRSLRESFLHNLPRAMFLFLLPFTAGWVRFVLWLYIPWYMYRSMRVVYGQGRWLTFAKLLVLSLFYLLSGVLMIALTTAYSYLTL